MATFSQMLAAASIATNSSLCVGLDPDPSKFSKHYDGSPDGITAFCKDTIDAAEGLAFCFKPQIAYFAANRAESALEAVIEYIHSEQPGIPVILDAKRGDIGTTAEQYAREAFERYGADAVTLSPFLGPDSVEPYLRYDDKGLILLDWTSNPGSAVLQGRYTLLSVAEMKAIEEQLGEELSGQQLLIHDWLAYDIAHNWGIPPDRLGLVVGATHPGGAQHIRRLAGPNPSLLIPGIGAQGGSEADAMAAWNGPGSVVVSASRSILYPELNPGEDYLEGKRRAARTARDTLNAARPNLTTA